MDDEMWDPTVFSKNRDRLLNEEVADYFSRRCWNGGTVLVE